MFISDQTHDLLEKDLRDILKISRILKSGKVPTEAQLNRLRFGGKEMTSEFSAVLMEAISNSTYTDDKERSSASFPIYNSNWVIGMFGSVFCDMKIGKSNYRVHLITKNNAEKHGHSASTLGNTLFIYVEKN